MADELISRQALLAEMRRSGRAAYMIVQEAPAVDAVEVVRCKDCKYGGSCEVEYLLREAVKTENPYCAAGERREENAAD